MSTIFLPSKINVGYQERDDTYTGRLAYVIYYDQKGKLRKEKSWNSWRDKKIPNQEFDNVPTEGFVLNKKVGDYVSDWNHRKSYCRVYDPRGFEFEIEIENLLYILENANSIKGKGLEGKFLYGWEDGNLILIPEEAPEYSQYVEFTNMLVNKESIKGKDLVPGGTYRTNKNEDYVYLGRFDYYKQRYSRNSGQWVENESAGLHYFFQAADLSKKARYSRWYCDDYLIIKSLSNRVVKTVSTEPVSDYAEMMDNLECQTCYSPYDPSKDTYVTPTEVKETTVYLTLNGIRMYAGVRQGTKEPRTLYGKIGNNGRWFLYDLERLDKDKGRSGWGYYSKWKELKEIESGLDKEYYSDHYIKDTGVDFFELVEKFDLKVKKEFLVNGKEKQ